MVILLSAGIAFCVIAIIMLCKFALKELRIEMTHNQASSWHSYRRDDERMSDPDNPQGEPSTDFSLATSNYPPRIHQTLSDDASGAASDHNSWHPSSCSTFWKDPGFAYWNDDFSDGHSIPSNSGAVAGYSWETPSLWVLLGVANGLDAGSEDGRDEDPLWLLT
jgi:hypothetical protein